jgi:hypothetical protein
MESSLGRRQLYNATQMPERKILEIGYLRVLAMACGGGKKVMVREEIRDQIRLDLRTRIEITAVRIINIYPV